MHPTSRNLVRCDNTLHDSLLIPFSPNRRGHIIHNILIDGTSPNRSKGSTLVGDLNGPLINDLAYDLNDLNRHLIRARCVYFHTVQVQW